MTQWQYDGSNLSSADGVIGHDGSYDGSYTTRGNVTAKLQWAGVDTVYAQNQTIGTFMAYDIAGNVVNMTDPNGNLTTFTYNDDSSNEYAFPTKTKNALQQVTTASYDYNIGKPLNTKDLNNAQTTYTYNDPLGRLTETINAVGAKTTVQYPIVTQGQAFPLPYRIDSYQDIDATQKLHTATLYDGFGQPVETQTYESGTAHISTTKTFDVLGRVIAATNPSRGNDNLNLATLYSFDQLSRQTTVTATDNTSVVTSYAGNQTTTTDQAGISKSVSTDALGRLASVMEDPGGKNLLTSYSFDALDNLTQVQQSGQTRTFSYDGLARLSWSNQPENGTINYRYDAAGNLVWRDDNIGQQTCYSYDPLNRISQKAYYQGSVPDGQNENCGAIPSTSLLASTSRVNYVYGSNPNTFGVGRLIAISNTASETDFGYDAVGRVVAETQVTNGQGYSLSYEYNLAGSLTKQTYPSGRQVKTDYDAVNRATTVTGTLQSQPTSYMTNVSYAPHGAFQSYSYGNGLAVLYAYNARLQPIERTDTLSSSANCGGASNAQYTGQNQFLLDLAFFWGGSATQINGNNGSLLSELIQTCLAGTANNQYQTFSYDSLNRLTQMTDNGGGGNSAQAFTYDAYGNRFYDPTTSGGTLPVSPLLPTAGQVDGNNHLTSPGASYDGAGNLMAIGAGANAEGMSYDAEGKTVSVTSGGATTTYSYDGSGQRVRKDGNGNTTVYVYDAQGAMAAEYSTVAVTMPCRTCYLSVDHLGSTRMITDQSGQVVARHDYLAFGEEIGAGYAGRPINSVWGGADSISQKFTGKERDQESGLDYFGARYYGASLGRFTSPDDVFASWDQHDPQTFNLYGYVRNNPLRYTDPDGHSFNVCVSDGNGAKQCVKLDDDQYQQLFNQQNGQQGINLPGGPAGGSITCGGANCGFVSYTPDSLYDPVPGVVAGAMVGDGAGLALKGAFRGIVSLFTRDAGEEGGVVIGKMTDLKQPGTLKAGERELDLPNLNDPKANWAQNSSRLREAMSEGKPIRDASAEPLENGNLGKNTGFLRAERNLLENRGWSYRGGYWYPPSK